jgi:hypothetical protein
VTRGHAVKVVTTSLVGLDRRPRATIDHCVDRRHDLGQVNNEREHNTARLVTALDEARGAPRRHKASARNPLG